VSNELTFERIKDISYRSISIVGRRDAYARESRVVNPKENRGDIVRALSFNKIHGHPSGAVEWE
jgi:hypothetical protein